MDWCYLASSGASGGILLLWDRRVEKIEKCVREFTIACPFINIKNGFSWAFVGVYEPNSDCDRSIFHNLRGFA